MKINRSRLRENLETLNSPVQGLIKKYQAPFTKYTASNPDAHEALGLMDLCMAKFNETGGIEVESNSKK